MTAAALAIGTRVRLRWYPHGRSNLPGRPRPELGQHVRHRALPGRIGMALALVRPPVLPPQPGHAREGAGIGSAGGSLLALALLHWVCAGSQQLASLSMARSGFHQRDLRIPTPRSWSFPCGPRRGSPISKACRLPLSPEDTGRRRPAASSALHPAFPA